MNDKTHIVWHNHSVPRRSREELNGHRGGVVWFTGLSGSGKSTVANAVDHLLHRQGVHTYLLDGDNVRHGLNASAEILAADYDEAFAERFGLGFAPEDRTENIRRIGAVSKLFCAAGILVLTAFVSPYREDRDAVRRQVNRVSDEDRPDRDQDGGELDDRDPNDRDPNGGDPNGGDPNGGDPNGRDPNGRGPNDGHHKKDDFIEVFVDTPLEICEARDPKGLYKLARAGEIKNFSGIDAPYEAPNSPELTLAGGDKTPEQLAQQVIDFLQLKGKLNTVSQ